MDEEKPKLISHGFSSWVSFLQASISLGITIGSVLVGALLFFFDGRYASAELERKVVANAETVNRMEDSVTKVEMRLIARDYRDTWTDYCRASSPEARRILRSRIADLEDDWKGVTRDGLPKLLPCEDIVR